MNLYRDILDKQILDRKKMQCGKVDGLIMTVRPRAQPQITHIELGSVTLARRVGQGPARFVARFARVSRGKQRQVPYRVEWNKVKDIGVDVEMDIDGNTTPYGRIREWLVHHVLKYLPKGKGK
jgi:hypothetical protein